MAKINSVRDLPEWYKLSKYDDAKNLTAIDWLEQLNRRKELLELHPDYAPEIPVRDDAWKEFALEFWRITMHEKAEKVRDAPLEAPTTIQLKKWISDSGWQPIKNIRLLDLMNQKQRDSEAQSSGRAPVSAFGRWRMLTDDPYPLIGSLSEACAPFHLSNHFDKTEIPVISVDLGATDASLKEAFDLWLTTARAARAPITRKKPLYERWAKYGVLPYIDLLIWSIETDSTIPDRVYSAAISKYEDMGEANLRKTVIPIANDLLSDLSDLGAIAALEALTEQP